MSEEKRYISLEELKKFPLTRENYDKENGSVKFISGCETVIDWAENLPKEDVAPVVHGHWNFGFNVSSGKCSVCGCRYESADEFDYCPSCGAKMDEGVEE